MKRKIMAMLRIILMALAVAFFIRFFLPIPIKGVVNIGNLTGMGCCTVLFLYGLFMRQVNLFVKLAWGYVVGRVLLLLLGLALAGILVLVVIETICMIRATTIHPVTNPEATVVVLGCKSHADHPSEMLETRLKATIQYLEENPTAVAVLSGGQGEDEPVTEASCMYDYLTAHGIDEGRLYLEDSSKDTKENLLNTMEVIRKEQLNEDIVLISNEFHLYRATMLAEHLEIDYSVYAADTPGWALPTYYVRELYGILHEWITLRG